MTFPTTSASLAVGSNIFELWAREGQKLLDAIRRETNRPEERRILRTFRRNEALEIGDLSGHQWLKYRSSLGLSDSAEARVTLADIHRMQEAVGNRPSRPPGTRPIRAAISNFKGGAGKTSVSLHLSHYLAFRGWRVLIVDTDPQGTLSRFFDYLPEEVDPETTLSIVFGTLDSMDIPTITPTTTHVDGLDILPASLDMIGADIRVASAFQSGAKGASNFYKLIDLALQKVEDDYDIILLDTAPAFSFAALNLMWAANALIIPVPPSMPDFSASVDFCKMLFDIISSIEGRVGTERVWNPAVVAHTRVDRSATSDGIRKMSRRVWGLNQVEEVVPESRVFMHAFSRFRSLYEVTASEVDSRALRRAREAVDTFGARMVQHFRAAWAEQLASADAEEIDHG